MKTKLLLLNMVYIWAGCSHSQQMFNTTTNISKIKFLYVPSNIETPFDVHCCNFEQFFQNRIRTVTTTDSLLIDNIVTALNNLEDEHIRTTPDVDTRMKMQLYNNDTIQEVICMEQYVVQRKNRLYLYSDELKKILNKLINSQDDVLRQQGYMPKVKNLNNEKIKLKGEL
jgi:hypothetical protein